MKERKYEGLPFPSDMYENYEAVAVYGFSRAQAEKILEIRGYTPNEIKKFLDHMEDLKK